MIEGMVRYVVVDVWRAEVVVCRGYVLYLTEPTVYALPG